MESLNRKIQHVWIATSVIIGAVLAAIVFGVSTEYFGFNPAFVLPVIVLLPGIMAVYSFYRYKNWGFKVENDHLNVKHGVLWKISMDVPYVRVQHVDTNRSPLERMLGLASLRVYTAGSKGADIRIPGLKRARAEEIQEDLKEKAIESEHGFDGV